jgi:putative membrane protein
MKVFGLFWAQMSQLAANKAVLYSVIAALLVPVVYGGILLSPQWGPYDNLSNLPVAVVNNDKGAVSDGEPLNVGDDLVADLKSSKDLGWKFVDANEAEKGMESFDYYMVIEIPEDFSERVTTVLDEDPKKLELNYIQNEGLNFMAAQVTKSAAEKLREKLANKVTEKYASNIFASLGDVSEGFKSAADGSAQLHAGTKELENGTAQLAGSLAAKQADITKLANGSKELKKGTGQLLSSLNVKSADISRLADGSLQVNAGTALLLQKLKEGDPGIKKLADGGQKLAKSVPELKAGTAGILTGLQGAQLAVRKEIGPGTQAVAGGIGEVITNSQKLGTSLSGLTALLEAYIAKHPELTSDTDFLTILGTSRGITGVATNPDNGKKLQELQAGANAIAAAFKENNPPQPKSLADGINQLVAGQTSIDNGVGLLAASAPELAAGTSGVAAGWSDLITNVTKLQAGTAQVAEGNQSVHTGWGTMAAGVKKLDSGAGQISSGNATVEKGWGDLTAGVTKLNEGAGKLYDGSGELASGLEDGAAETGKIQADEQNIGMFASPLELVSNKVHEYEHYRDSTAPYVMTLALFVGILIVSMFIDFNKPEDLQVSGLSWYGAKFMKLASLAVVQAILLSSVVLLFLNMNIANPLGFVFFAIFTSIAFAAIVLFFASFGNIGRFILFAIVVMQLSTTGANLPIDMLPENLRSLSVYMPFTYSIAGFKSLISLNSFGEAMSNLFILMGYFTVFTLLSMTLYFLKTKDQHQQSDLAV